MNKNLLVVIAIIFTFTTVISAADEPGIFNPATLRELACDGLISHSSSIPYKNLPNEIKEDVTKSLEKALLKVNFPVPNKLQSISEAKKHITGPQEIKNLWNKVNAHLAETYVSDSFIKKLLLPEGLLISFVLTPRTTFSSFKEGINTWKSENKNKLFEEFKRDNLELKRQKSCKSKITSIELGFSKITYESDTGKQFVRCCKAEATSEPKFDHSSHKNKSFLYCNDHTALIYGLRIRMPSEKLLELCLKLYERKCAITLLEFFKKKPRSEIFDLMDKLNTFKNARTVLQKIGHWIEEAKTINHQIPQEEFIKVKDLFNYFKVILERIVTGSVFGLVIKQNPPYRALLHEPIQWLQ